jgi:hypothetical protein
LQLVQSLLLACAFFSVDETNRRSFEEIILLSALESFDFKAKRGPNSEGLFGHRKGGEAPM